MPSLKTNKFKVGDVVKTLQQTKYSNEDFGHIGQIINITEPYCIINVKINSLSTDGKSRTIVEYLITWQIKYIRYLNDIESAQYIVNMLI